MNPNTLRQSPGTVDPALAAGNISQQTEREAPTFAQFEQSQKRLSEKTISGIMEDSLEIVPGEKAFMVKSWLDQVPADESDAKFTSDPERIITYRNGMNDMVARNLKIRYKKEEIGEKGEQFLGNTKRNFLTKLETDKTEMATFMREYHAGMVPKYPRSAFEFYGLNVPTSAGRIDLLQKSAGNVRANFTMQREIKGLFVHYSSDRNELERMNGAKPELDKRIYLNPEIEQSVEIFQQIIMAADKAGIVMKAKILDRSIEAEPRNNSKKEGEYGLRADGIVLYAGADADELLGLVEAIYMDNPAAFKGRATPKIPQKIGEGIAIGDEPENDSLTSNRAEFLGKVRSEVQKRLGGKPADKNLMIATFNQVYDELAPAANINPRNLAFNLKQAA